MLNNKLNNRLGISSILSSPQYSSITNLVIKITFFIVFCTHFSLGYETIKIINTVNIHNLSSSYFQVLLCNDHAKIYPHIHCPYKNFTYNFLI